jgi:hypothetical protein
MSVIAASTSLADPDTRGEDLGYNYRLATAIAPGRCDGCARYHINFTLGRLMRLRTPYRSDENEFAEAVYRFARRRAHLPGPITILILGAADTGVPALVAHAALAAGVLDRTDFVVVDVCGTPLELCRDFAARHGLRMRTPQADVLALTKPASADLIVAHSLLRFIPAEMRVGCLERWRSWLKPGGRMIISNTFAPQSGRDTRSPFTEGLRELVAHDAIELAEPKDRFLARLAQPPPWPVTAMTEPDLVDLFTRAGLVAESMRIVWDGDATHPVRPDRGRVVAVFEGP